MMKTAKITENNTAINESSKLPIAASLHENL